MCIGGVVVCASENIKRRRGKKGGYWDVCVCVCVWGGGVFLTGQDELIKISRNVP
jgi:hypothetical protein